MSAGAARRPGEGHADPLAGSAGRTGAGVRRSRLRCRSGAGSSL